MQKNNKTITEQVQKKTLKIAQTLKNQNKEEIASDVTGSYTGETRDGEQPIQDADDL